MEPLEIESSQTRPTSPLLQKSFWKDPVGETPVEDVEALEVSQVRRAKILNAFCIAATVVQSSAAFVTHLFYAIGLSKIFEQVLGKGTVTNDLDDLWRALLMADWSFEAFLTFFVVFYSLIGVLDAVQKSMRFYLSKHVHKILRIRIAKYLLEEGNVEEEVDDLLEINKSAEMLRLYVEEIKYQLIWSYTLVGFGAVFSFIVTPVLFSIVAVRHSMAFICL